MVMDAKGASVDLRCPRHNELSQQGFKPIGLDRLTKLDPGLHCRRVGRKGIQSLSHR
jgi:hypothetical protein